MKELATLAIAVPVACIAQTPVITFEKTHHDFGKIGGDRKVSYRYKVTNTGQATLNISRLKPACGCTSTVLGKWSLAPGEQTEIEISFDPKGWSRGSLIRGEKIPCGGTFLQSFIFENVLVSLQAPRKIRTP